MAKQADVDAALDALNAKVVAGFDSLNSSLQAEFTAIIAEIRKLELATSEDLQPLVDKVNQTGVNIDAAIANIKTALDKESGDLGSGALD